MTGSPGRDMPIKDLGHKSLAARLSRATILIVISALIVTGAGLIFIAYHAEQQSLFELQESRADEVALLISGFTGSVKDELLLFEDTTPVYAMSPGDQKKTLERLLISRQAIFSQLTLLDTNGTETVRVSRFHTYLS